MHASVQTWVGQKTYGHEPYCNVVELGGLNVNGGVRQLVPHDRWTAIDLESGEGVDIVANAHDLSEHFLECSADLVLCLELLEHDDDPNATFASIARLLASDGRALVTTRSEFFPYHHPPDYWRFTPQDIAALAYTAGLNVVSVEQDPQEGHPGVFAELKR